MLLGGSDMVLLSALVESTAGLWALAALAAVLPKKIGERLERRVVSRVHRELPFALHVDQAGVHQSAEVVIERRPRHVQLVLELGCGDAIGSCLYDLSKQRQSRRMTESSKLLRMTVENARVHTSTYLDE